MSTKPLTITLDQIREEGLALDELLGLALLSEAMASEDDTGFHPTQPSRLKARLNKVSGGVLLHGDLTLHVAAPCKRCLVETATTLPVSFTLNLVPRAKRPEEELEDEGGKKEDKGAHERGGSFGLQDADQEQFDGKTIDLDPIVREQVLLALPMDVLCKDDCKGLCPMCGQNLNEKKCGCEPKTVDPRLAVLKNIKLN